MRHHTSRRHALLQVACVVLAAAQATPAHPLGGFPDLPGTAEETAREQDALSSYALPIGPWADGSMLTQPVEGRIERTAWRIAAPGASTLAILAPIRRALLEDGWRVLFECDALGCGGFDFRYSTTILPEPAMHVDLADFRFLALRRGSGDTAEYQSLLVSRSSVAGHVQRVLVASPAAGADPEPEPSARQGTPALFPVAPADPAVAGAVRSVAEALESGTVALDDLEFETGAAGLSSGDYASLAGLAAYLADHPDRAIVLVGHTDASGGLAANIALSKRRAEAVRARLIADHGVNPAQASAEGVGYLAPRASNLTEEGRTRNRRVEAMLASTR